MVGCPSASVLDIGFSPIISLFPLRSYAGTSAGSVHVNSDRVHGTTQCAATVYIHSISRLGSRCTSIPDVVLYTEIFGCKITLCYRGGWEYRSVAEFDIIQCI